MHRIPLYAGLFALTLFALTLTAGIFPAALEAQTASSTQTPPPAVSAPAPTPPCAAPTTAPVSEWQRQHDAQVKVDFPWLARFKEADVKLGPPAPGEDRVVFMGDSITDNWKLTGPGGSFPGKPYINRGISGQTTPQMLGRFRQDVIDLQPKVVVLLGGTNDLAGNTGPMTLEDTESNLASMADLATANHIQVVLCSITPSVDFPWQRGLDPAPKIDKLNAWINSYAAEKGYVYVDYHSALKDAQDGMAPGLSIDGVHPTPAGYALMAPLVEAGIEKALKGRE